MSGIVSVGVRRVCGRKWRDCVSGRERMSCPAWVAKKEQTSPRRARAPWLRAFTSGQIRSKGC